MARQISITDNLSTIQITYVQTGTAGAGSGTDNHLKTQIENITMIDADTVCIIFASQYKKPYIRLNWNEVTVPTVVSGADLYAQLLSMWLNMPAANIFTQTDTFTNADLVDGIVTFVLTITHPFNTPNLFLTIQNPAGDIITAFPANINPVAPYDVTVDFGGAIGAGSWSYTLIAIV